MLERELICSYIFSPLALKNHASVIAVYADAKVILNVRMIESDISPIASEWADALLRKVGCQVSALITHRKLAERTWQACGGKLPVRVFNVDSAELPFRAQ